MPTSTSTSSRALRALLADVRKSPAAADALAGAARADALLVLKAIATPEPEADSLTCRIDGRPCVLTLSFKGKSPHSIVGPLRPGDRLLSPVRSASGPRDAYLLVDLGTADSAGSRHYQLVGMYLSSEVDRFVHTPWRSRLATPSGGRPSTVSSDRKSRTASRRSRAKR